jgi:hypothetical protein
MALTLSGTPAINGLSVPTDTFVSGMVLVNKTDFSAASSVSINNCFSSAYENYRIALFMSTASANSIDVQFRLRISGTDNSASVYHNLSPGITSGNGSSNIAQDAATYFSFGSVGITSPVVFGVDTAIMRPFSVSTTYILGGRSSWAGTGANAGGALSCHHFGQTSFDGFSLIASTGNFTGTVRVYGYRNS